MSKLSAIPPPVNTENHPAPKRFTAEDVADRLGARRVGGGWKACCPAHEDTNPSLALHADPVRGFKVHCHAGCDQDRVLSAVLAIMRGETVAPNGNGHAPARAKVLPMEPRRPMGDHVAEYVYQNQGGAPVYAVRRYEPKDFRIWRYDAATQSFVPGLGDAERVPYRLPELMAAVWQQRDGKYPLPVFIAEGEKDVHNLAALDLTATCNANGAGNWRDSFSEAFRGAEHVAILPDNDEPGRAHALQVAASLARVGVKARILELPGLAEKGDVSDWIAAGGTRDELLDRYNTAPMHVTEERRNTDGGNADRLVDAYGSVIRFVPSIGWLVYDGKRWARDPEDVTMTALQRRVVERMYRSALDASDSDERVKAVREAAKADMERSVRNAIRLARSDERIRCNIADLDADPYLLNVENGTVDLRTGKIRPHRAADLITKITNARYSGTARAERWTAFLDEIMEGDAELVGYMQRALGYSATGLTDEHALFLCHGVGANGKSTLVETILHVMGDYAGTAETELLLEGKRDSTGRNGIPQLMGLRFVAAQESGMGRSLNEGTVKWITSSDTLRGREHYARSSVSFRPSHKLWLSTNHLPRIKGTDKGIWRRLRNVPFKACFEGAAKDRSLLSKLKAEADGILAYIVAGAVRYLADGALESPAAVEQATEEYREGEDLVAQFVADQCELGIGYRTKAADMLRTWRDWCAARGEPPIRDRDFSERMQRLTIPGATARVRKDEHKSRGRTWIGVRLVGETHELPLQE